LIKGKIHQQVPEGWEEVPCRDSPDTARQIRPGNLVKDVLAS
jgi:hypothetical protein